LETSTALSPVKVIFAFPMRQNLCTEKWMRFPNFRRSAASTETLGLDTPAESEATAASGETKANVFNSCSRNDIALVDRLAMALEA